MRRVSIILSLGVLAVALSGCVGTGGGPDWPMVRGSASGAAESPDREIDPPLGPIWEFRPGVQLSQPVVKGGVVYVAGDDGVLYALAAKKGEVRWRTPIAATSRAVLAAAQKRLYCGVEPGVIRVLDRARGLSVDSVTVAGAAGQDAFTGLVLAEGMLYAALESGRITAYRAGDSLKQSWSKELETGIAGGPVVAAGRLVVTTAREPAVACLDARTGEPLWKTPLEGDGTWSAPAVYESFGAVLVASGSAGRLIALDVGSGQKKWEFAADGTLLGAPALAGGMAIIAAQSPDGDARLWTIDVYNGKKVMARVLAGAPAAPPIVANHAIYVPVHGAKNDYLVVNLWKDEIIGAGYNEAGGRFLCVGAERLFVVGQDGVLRCYGKVDLRPKESASERARRLREELSHPEHGALH